MPALCSTKPMAKWCPPKFDRWVSSSASQTAHRECGDYLDGRYHQVVNFTGTNFFVARHTEYLCYFDVTKPDEAVTHDFGETITNMAPFQLNKVGSDNNMVIVTLVSGVRLRVILQTSGATHFVLPGEVGLCYCPGVYEDTHVVFCLHPSEIEVIASWGEILATQALPGLLDDQDSLVTMRYLNDQELEVKWEYDNLIVIFDPQTLNMVNRERFSSYFLDVSLGQILFQDSFHTIAFRRSQEDGDVEYLRMEVSGLVTKAEIKNNNNYAMVACENALQIFDLRVTQQDRCVRVSGTVTDWATTDHHLVVTHGGGLTCFIIS